MKKIFYGIRKHLPVLAEKFNSHLFRDTQGFSALGLESVGTCHVVKCTLQAPSTNL